MRNALTLVAALTLFASCTPQQNSLIITGTFPPPKTDGTTVCLAGKPAVAQYYGTLDVALTHDYLVVFAVDSLFEKIETVQSGNIAVLDQFVFNYTTEAGPTGTPIGFPTTETVSVTFTVPPASTDALLLTDIIGPQAKVALQNVPSTAYTDYFTLKVELRMKGKLLSGGAVQTNSVTYPVQIYNQGLPCASGTVVRATGPCGNTGQDGAYAGCCTPDPASGTCK